MHHLRVVEVGPRGESGAKTHGASVAGAYWLAAFRTLGGIPCRDVFRPPDAWRGKPPPCPWACCGWVCGPAASNDCSTTPRSPRPSGSSSGGRDRGGLRAERAVHGLPVRSALRHLSLEHRGGVGALGDGDLHRQGRADRTRRVLRSGWTTVADAASPPASTSRTRRVRLGPAKAPRLSCSRCSRRRPAAVKRSTMRRGRPRRSTIRRDVAGTSNGACPSARACSCAVAPANARTSSRRRSPRTRARRCSSSARARRATSARAAKGPTGPGACSAVCWPSSPPACSPAPRWASAEPRRGGAASPTSWRGSRLGLDGVQ
ncbi:hypothetical protein EMGBD4_12770 [Verrucomicrobiota bacterium]|nr:hypothetical protein EMGBD4_12770 [Verrucomicrobiota bacterium]